MDYAGGVVSASYPPTFWSKLPGRDMTVLQRLYNMFNKMANMAMMREVLLQAGMGSNGVTVTKFLHLLMILELFRELSYFLSQIFIAVTKL